GKTSCTHLSNGFNMTFESNKSRAMSFCIRCNLNAENTALFRSMAFLKSSSGVMALDLLNPSFAA
ncbi:hypothetical protein, partial [Phocaeicola vulgatus]|uniref:hypothetical protein n=1 Tax=Phocaeicola vulgatus TaxID=821 RepID=UPI00210B8580